MTQDLTAILDDARRLDRLAAGGRPGDPATALLADLRRALETPGTPAGTRRRPHHGWRRSAAIAVMAAALPLAGVTGAAAAAHPGDVLYPVRRTMIGRTADDPWTARHLVEQARRALVPATPPAAVTPAQVVRAQQLLDQASASVPDLRESDAQDLSRRIMHLEHRIKEAVSRVHATKLDSLPKGLGSGHHKITISRHPAARPLTHLR